MKKLVALIIGYMLAVALCLSGIILNSDAAFATNGNTNIGGGANPTLNVILWSLIAVLTVAVIAASIIILRKEKATRLLHSNS